MLLLILRLIHKPSEHNEQPYYPFLLQVENF